MNTIQVQLDDKQYRSLVELLDYAQENLSSDVRSLDKDNEDTSPIEALLDNHEEIMQKLTSTKSYLWTSSTGSIELEIPAEVVESVCYSGDNEPAVLQAIEEHSYLTVQLKTMNMESACEHLEDTGIEDAAEKSNDDLRMYILWMACWDIHEEQYQED